MNYTNEQKQLNSKAYLYIRDNEYFRSKNILKIGITTSLLNRNDQYITYEHERGEFIFIIEIPLDKMSMIDKLLKNYLVEYRNYVGAGTEFYDRNVIELIEPWFQLTNINYKILTKSEIDELNRNERIRILKNIIKNHLEKRKKYKQKKHRPNQYQQEILNLIENFYLNNDQGKLIWTCGLGKTLLSIFINKKLGFKSVIIGIPSKNLQNNFKNEILKIFPNKKNILFVGGDINKEIKTTTDKNEIKRFLYNDINTEPKFIISTYHSCHLLVDNDLRFNFKIGDEAHHLVGIEKEEEKGFRLFHKINSKKSLFMTATEKIIETKMNTEIYSMDDEKIFGPYIDQKSVQWAIVNRKITDYNILVLKNTEDEVNTIISSLKLNIINPEIFIACYMCLKSIEKYNDLSHLLLYTNTTDEANLAHNYIDQILSLNILSIPKERIYNKSLHSKNCKTNNNINTEISLFKNSPIGIISCVYLFGEGFNLPKLNGICVAVNMQSENRIVQYLLRPNRLDIENPNKKAYIIIPYIDSDDWYIKNKPFEKVRHIISQMRNVDENIEQKISVLVEKIKDIDEEKKKDKKDKKIQNVNYILEESNDELNKIKLRLRYSKTLKSKFTEEQDEYNYYRSYNKSLKIQSILEYYESQKINSCLIRFPEEYFKSKGVWNSWYDFLGVDSSKFIQSKQEWKDFCNDKNIKTLIDYDDLCKIYDILPKEPAEFYKNFSNIFEELGLNIKRKRKSGKN